MRTAQLRSLPNCFGALLALLLSAAPAAAQSFDCARAQDSVDRAICASPRLRDLDGALGRAYGTALARDPAQADAVRQAQRGWAHARAGCMAAGSGAEACLEKSYADRIAALAPPALAPAAPLPPAPPAAAASLERETVPAAGETDVLLHVTVPGRFAIRARSATGMALQLVDMLAGPGPREGFPGKQDGRIDVLLDFGTYKLRVFGDQAATGEAKLSVTGFAEAGPPQLAPGYQPITLTLADLQQRSFWLVVGEGQAPVRVEAAGRSLKALKVWRDGRDLVALEARLTPIAPLPAHPLTDIVLAGPLQAGSYLVTAYGGPALPWSDGAADQPLYLRTGRSTELATGGAAGAVGPFGSEVFAVPKDAAQALLILPAPAAAHLLTTDGEDEVDRADLSRAQREPTALLDLPEKPKFAPGVALQAAPGQGFVLRPVPPAGAAMPNQPGDYLFAAAAFAQGGDEAPAAALLERVLKDGTGEVLAAPFVPAIGPAAAWRTSFNLRGTTALLVHVTAPVTVAVQAAGPPVEPAIATLDGAVMNATGNGRAATRWALSPGYYGLVLQAKPDAVGILDLTLGPPGMIPTAPAAHLPYFPVLPLGVRAVDKDSLLRLRVNEVPDFASALIARPVPVELGDGPVTLTLPAGQGTTLAVHVAKPGRLVVRDLAGGPPLQEQDFAEAAFTSVVLPPAAQARTLAVGWLPRASPALPAPQPPAALAALRDGQPAFLDLARDGTARFALTVAQGGLYRVETLGRLRTVGRLATAFLPDFDEATANGAGSNMLLQRYLRAGSYRLEIAARDSAGRVGVLAAPAPLLQGAALRPSGTARATMPAGSGVAFPIEIAAAGRYHLDLLGVARRFTARLEDAEGWPLRAADQFSALDEDFSPGHYRLIVQPEGVDARVVARLRQILPPQKIVGHGPHPLPFDAPQSAEWREPAARDAPRTPDTWRFALAGPAKVTLRLEGDGMVAALRSAAAPDEATPLARVLAGRPQTLALPAGSYRVAASSLGRNDRLPYTIALGSEELQPDTPRDATLPADLAFSIAAGQVANLTSFGTVPVRAVLRAASGTVLDRVAGRTDDWNLGLSRLLPPGRYRLELAALPGPPPAPPQPESKPAEEAAPAEGEAAANGDASEPAAPEMAPSQPDQSAAEPPSPAAEPEAGPPHTEVTLALLPDPFAAPRPGAGLALPAAAPGGLVIAAAEAPVEVVLAIAAPTADGGWHSLAQDTGRAPVVALPATPGASTWRAAVWAIDGGDLPIRLAAATVAPEVQPVGKVQLAPVQLGLDQAWRAALVADPGAAMLRPAAPVAGLLAASRPGQPAVPPEGGAIVAQSDRVWLLAPAAAAPGLTLAVAQATAGLSMPISLPAGARAALPVAPAAVGRICGFIATSGLGQPGLEAGRGMDAGAGSAFALCGGAPLAVWNAGGGDALRLALRRDDLARAPEQAVDADYSGTIPAHGAVPLRLPAGMKRLEASLAPGGVLIAGWHDAGAITAWAGTAALSRTLIGDWTEVLLANTGDTPAPAALTASLAESAPVLGADQVFRRFFGAGGSFVLPVAARPGQRFVLAGAARATLRLRDGQVREGRTVPLDGPATAVVAHGAGALAAWIEGDGAAPWPAAAPRDVALPQRIALDGEALALRLAPGAPALLHVRSTAPVILAFGDEPPELFGDGASFDRYLSAGEVVMRLLSPQDGPLSGTLDLAASPVAEVGEGLGAAVAVAPGATALFGFTVTAEGPVGLGVRADPDRVAARLLDGAGKTLGRGVSMLHRLMPGHYLLAATVPADAPTTLIRPAVLGIVPHPTPPPAEVVRRLLLAAGFTPPDQSPRKP